MLRSTLLAILVLTLVVPAFAEPMALDVMTFNVRYGTADDGEDSWEHRRDAVIAMLAENSPDVVGMQECLDFQADEIVDALSGYRWFGVGREKDGTGERMAVLYRWKELGPVRIENTWLSETPFAVGSRSWEAAYPRMVTTARFHHYASGLGFDFFNTHFDYLSEEARRESAKLLRGMIDAATGPVVATGDFNAVAESSAPYEILVGDGVRDAWVVADERTGPVSTFNGFGPPPDDDRRIDWILVRGNVEVQHCEAVVYEVDGRYVSDHLPVIASLVIRP